MAYLLQLEPKLLVSGEIRKWTILYSPFGHGYTLWPFDLQDISFIGANILLSVTTDLINKHWKAFQAWNAKFFAEVNMCWAILTERKL